MTGGSDDDDEPWLERLVTIASWLGLSPTTTRWRLKRLTDRLTRLRLSQGTTAPGRRWRREAAEGSWLGAVSALPATMVLGAALCLVFLRTLLHEREPSFDSPTIETLMHFGGHYGPLVREGELWRLGTAVFLHAGVLHLGFNLYALAHLGPGIEEVHGRGWVWFGFLVTGLLANVLSDVFIVGVGIGASGAICGLLGMTAAWGHREATTAGRDLRNRMLRWFAYTVVFGLLIGADNWAHLGGFVAGALLGRALPDETEKRLPRLTQAAGFVGLAGCAALFVATLAPVSSVRGDEIARRWTRGEADPWQPVASRETPPLVRAALHAVYDDSPGPLRTMQHTACAAHERGDHDAARTALSPMLERGWTPQMIEAVQWNAYCARVRSTDGLCESYPHLDACRE